MKISIKDTEVSCLCGKPSQHMLELSSNML